MYKRVLKNLAIIDQIKLSAKDISWHLTWKAELICNNLQQWEERGKKTVQIMKNLRIQIYFALMYSLKMHFVKQHRWNR